MQFLCTDADFRAEAEGVVGTVALTVTPVNAPLSVERSGEVQRYFGGRSWFLVLVVPLSGLERRLAPTGGARGGIFPMHF